MSNKTKMAVSMPYTILALIALCMLLTACDLYEETAMNTSSKIQLQESRYSETYDVKDLDNLTMTSVVRHYTKHGDGPLDLTVTYDPKVSGAGAMKAGDEAARIATFLRKKGLSEVKTGIMPVVNSGKGMQALVSYDSFYAEAPQGCGTIPGFADRRDEFEEEDGYELGCTRDTLIARQLARPADLKGRQISPTTDGRRVANSTETYRTGVPNQPLTGESASGDE